MSSTGRIPWLRVFGEGAVIVVSILLAFALDAAWEERSRQREEIELLGDLLEEFRENLQLIERELQNHTTYAERADLLLKVADGEPVPDDDTLERLLYNAFIGRTTYNPVSGTLDSYLSSGDPELVSNPELRRALAGWPRVVDDSAEDELRLTQFMDTQMKPFLAFRAPIQAVLSPSPPAYMPSITPSTDALNLSRIMNQEGRSLVTLKVVAEWLAVREATSVVEAAHTIIGLLETELAALGAAAS